MPEQADDLGVDDFNCITTDTSDSASEEMDADMFAGEANVLTELSDSRDKQDVQRQGVVVGRSRIEKRSMSTCVGRIISIWYPSPWVWVFRVCQFGDGRWIECAKPQTEAAAHRSLPVAC